MVKDGKLLEKFEQNLLRNTEVTFEKNLKIYEKLFEEAIAFGVLPKKDPLDGIEVKIKLAKILNYVKRDLKSL
jgi:hypothetical protein